MIRGCKHYFTMFGILLSSINTRLLKFFSQIEEQFMKSIAIDMMNITHARHTALLEKNQTYQGK